MVVVRVGVEISPEMLTVPKNIRKMKTEWKGKILELKKEKKNKEVYKYRETHIKCEKCGHVYQTAFTDYGRIVDEIKSGLCKDCQAGKKGGKNVHKNRD